MAITKELRGVEVTVVVDGSALKEYQDHDLEEQDHTTTRFVEAVSGKIFEVHLNLDKGCKFFGTDLAFDIYVDGKWINGPLVSKTKCTTAGVTRVSKGVRVAQDKVKALAFASIETVKDEHTPIDGSTRIADLGTIVVKVTHVTRGAVRAGTSKAAASIDGTEALRTISEKALKGRTVSHSIGFSGETFTKTRTTYHTTSVNGQPEVFFKFCYRSLEALKSMLIIPRTPTPVPLEERDIDTLNPEEMKQLLRQHREKQAVAVKIKRERQDDDNPRPRKFARPSVNSAQLELDDEGHMRESSTPTATAEPEIIELD